jgi:glycosyltransferase involved in cell wall biosynthesis
MKALFYHFVPFAFAHGGLQIQIEQTREALEKVGVQVEFLRWYDGEQTGDVLHFFGRIPVSLANFAHQKGMKVVMSELLTGQGSRSVRALKIQKTFLRYLKKAAPGLLTQQFGWESYRMADACIALTAWEAQLMAWLFSAPPEKVHVVPNGVEDIFFQSQKAVRGQWLVCTATLTERKRVLELAEAAVTAKTPLWIIGKPYSDADTYAARMIALARSNPSLIRYEGAIGDRTQLARVYREARGFVLLSAMESLSLSALEAAACECPLLLSDLPWARMTFKEEARYCPLVSPSQTAPLLRKFYDDAPTLGIPAKPLRWVDVASELKTIYESLFSTSR